MTGPFLTIKEACNYAKVGRSTLYKLMDHGEIVSYKPRGKRLVDRESLEAWIKRDRAEVIELAERMRI